MSDERHDELSLEGRTILVTGAAGGLAGPLCDVLAEGGAHLLLADLPGPRLDERAAALGGVAAPIDLRDPEAARARVAELEAAHGPLDGVVATVGGFAMGPAAEEEPEVLDRMVSLNLRTLATTVRAVLPSMRERGRGTIVGIAAGPAWTGSAPGMASYAASKSAVATWLRSVDGELGGTDVRILVVYPMGAIDTPGNRAAMPDEDPGTWIDPRELGWAVRFAMTRSRRGRLLELPVYPPR